MRSLWRAALADVRAWRASDEAGPDEDHGISGYYVVDTGRIKSKALAGTYVALGPDAATLQFVRDSCLRPRTEYLVKGVIHSLLTCFTSATNASALLGKANMWVLSTSQTQTLLDAAAATAGAAETDAGSVIRPFASLLDVGAGAGSVTEQIAPFAEAVVATETARVNVWCLGRRGFTALDAGTLDHDVLADAQARAGIPRPRPGEPVTFDLVSCFNVLDRCDAPVSLLDEMVSLVAPGRGRLMLSIVLPYNPSVEVGSSWHPPSEHVVSLLGDDAPFEDWVSWFVDAFLTPAGLDVLAWSRVPYISPGNSEYAFYVLYNAVFVCAPTR